MVKLADLNTTDQPNWCPGCVLPGTLIHTNPSIEKIENLKEGAKVLGSDGRYHKITKTFSHLHKGALYKIKTKYFGETNLTNEHPVLVVRKKKNNHHNKNFDLAWVETEKLRHGDYLVYPVLKEFKDVDFIEFNYIKKKKDTRSKRLKKITNINEFLRLCGYYLSEGHMRWRELSFTFNIKEIEYIEDIKNIVKNLFDINVSIRSRPRKNTVEVIINSVHLCRIFNDWFGRGAANKKIPHWIMLLPKEKQIDLIKGLWRGDGYVSKKRAGYKTISKLLVEQLKVLLLRQGIIPMIYTEKAHENHREAYSMFVIEPVYYNKLMEILGRDNIKENTSNITLLIKDEYLFLPIRKIEKSDYNGLVYNLEVEYVQSYVTQNAILHNCGDFPLLLALKMALSELNINQEDVLLVSGIGCGSKTPYWTKVYGFNGLHGRPLPVATGAKLANNKLTVIIIGGDGDGYSEGGNHFLHTMRRNIDMTYIVQDNQVYGLTTGQFSPTAEKGFKSKSSPRGVIEIPINPLAIAISTGATFVARGFSGDPQHLRNLIMEGVKHKGFALIDVFQPCVTFNHHNTYEWFRERVYKLEETNYKADDKLEAFKKSLEWGEKIPIGIIYRENRETQEDLLPQIKESTLIEKDISNINIKPLLDELV